MFAARLHKYSRRLTNEDCAEGVTEDRTAERVALTRSLLNRGETVEDIADLTRLSTADVVNLTKERSGQSVLI